MTQKSSAPEPGYGGLSSSDAWDEAVVCRELRTHSPIYQRGNGGWEKGSDSWTATQPGRAGTRLGAEPQLPSPHPLGLSPSRHRGPNPSLPESGRPPVEAGMGRKAARRPHCCWQEQAGTPWDLTLTHNSWFPGGIALGRAAQPTAKTLILIANKGQTRPRKSCRFLRHAGSSSLGGQSLRSPRGIGMRAPLFHIRQGHVLGSAVWCGTFGKLPGSAPPSCPASGVELEGGDRLQDGALGGREGARVQGKTCVWWGGGCSTEGNTALLRRHIRSFPSVLPGLWLCPAGMRDSSGMGTVQPRRV